MGIAGQLPAMVYVLEHIVIHGQISEPQLFWKKSNKGLTDTPKHDIISIESEREVIRYEDWNKEENCWLVDG